MFTAKSNDKLPPTHDIERATREQEAFRSKEKIVEVTGALGEGKLPTTSQISTAIDEIHQSEILHDAARGMSVLGKKISADLENFLEALKIFLKEKNRGDEIQNLVYNSSRAINDNLPSGEEIKQEISDIATTSKPLLSEGVEKTLNISRLLISSSEFRKLVNDISTIAQDIIAYAVNEEPNQNNDNYDKEKGIDEAITEIGQKAREQVYPTVKTTAKITEPYIKDASEGVFSNEDLDQITKVINGVCKNLQKCFTTLHLDNSEASFKRDQAPYFGIDRLPGVGPVDIFAALIQGLKSVVIQKLKCEETNSVMSIDATTSSSGNAGENHCILKGCNQLKLTKPASFQHFDKENNVRFEIEVKIPIIYQLDSSDPHRAWDYLSEIWEFKPLEHTIYFSPLVYRIVTELSAIYSVLENVHQEIAKETSTQVSSSTQTNEGAIITTVTTVTTKIMIPKQFLYSDYARFKKTFRRRLYYVAHVDRIKDIILEVQEPWVQ
ncbi:12_t:CDS:2, partial [Entrophospora sp. SA101]